MRFIVLGVVAFLASMFALGYLNGRLMLKYDGRTVENG